jgi:hypothetical protein
MNEPAPGGAAISDRKGGWRFNLCEKAKKFCFVFSHRNSPGKNCRGDLEKNNGVGRLIFAFFA